MDEFSRCTGFQWDEGNAEKNWIAHLVSRAECEQAFFNQPFVVAETARPSQPERRYYALGETDAGRSLFMVFTIREDLIRVISARDMSRNERRAYGDAKEQIDTDV